MKNHLLVRKLKEALPNKKFKFKKTIFKKTINKGEIKKAIKSKKDQLSRKWLKVRNLATK